MSWIKYPAQSSTWNTSSTSILKYFDIRSINSADGVLSPRSILPTVLVLYPIAVASIFVTFTLKTIIDWNISFQTVSCIHLMNVDVYDCNSHIHNPACFHLTLDLFQTVWSSSGQFLLLGYTLYWRLRWFVLLLIQAGPSFFEFRLITFVRVCHFNHLHFHFDYIIYSSVGVTTLLYHHIACRTKEWKSIEI